MRAEAKLRGRLGEDRIPGGPRQLEQGLAQGRIGLAAGEDQAARSRVDSLRELVEKSRVGGGAGVGNGGERPVAAALQRQRRGRSDVSVDGNRGERVAPGQVQVHRTGPGLAP